MEDWYDSTMDRVTGWYTRHTAVILFIIGIGAAVVMNVDSVTIAKRLITDKALRESVVAQAEKFASDATPKGSSAPNRSGASETTGGTSDLAGGSPTFTQLRAEFDEIGFPIGWASVDGVWYPAPQACTRMPGPAADSDEASSPGHYACDKKF